MRIVQEPAGTPAAARRGEVTVRWCSLDAPPRCPAILSAAEQRRADGFATETLRARHRSAHTWLRHLLGQALGRDPAAVELTRRPCTRCGRLHGKPALHASPTDVDFNLSHTGSRAAVAIGREARIGIDVERVRAGHDLQDVSHLFLHASEADAIDALAPADRALARLGQWVRKEALLKGSGHGLNIDPRTVVLPVAGPRFGAEHRVEHAGASWLLVDIPTDGAIAAVAASPAPAALRWALAENPVVDKEPAWD